MVINNENTGLKGIDERNDFAKKMYGHLPTDQLNIEEYINDIIVDAIRIDYHRGICDGYRNLAYHYIMTNSSSDAYPLLQKVDRFIEIYELEDIDKIHLYNAYLCYYLEVADDFESSVVYGKKALELAEKANDNYLITRLKSNLGVINARLGHYESAKEFYEVAIEYCLANGDEYHLMYDYNNLAEVYMTLNDISKAQELYKEANEISIKNDEICIIIDSSIGLSQTYSLLGDYDSAIEYIVKAIEFSKKSNNLRDEIESTIELAKIYMKTDFDEKALEILNGIEFRLNEVPSNDISVSFYEMKANIESKLQNYEQAFKCMKTFHEYYVKSNLIESERALNGVMRNEYKMTVQRLEAISKVGRELTTLSNVSDVLSEVFEILAELMDIDCIGIGEINGSYIEYNNFMIEGYKVAPSKLRIDDHKSLAAWSIRHDEEINISDLEKEYKLYVDEYIEVEIQGENSGKVKDDKIQSVLYSPLKFKDEIIGVFTIQSYKSNVFMSKEVEIFRIITAYITIALINVSQSKSLMRRAFKDSLTNLDNRRGLTDRYYKITRSNEIQINEIALIMMDIDFFKRVNDNYGHDAGDEVLKAVAAIFLKYEENLTMPTRLGGEEFAFILLNKSKNDVLQFAEKIRFEIENLIVNYKGENINITISIGVTTDIYFEGIELKKLYNEADKALFYVKKNGRNGIKLY